MAINVADVIAEYGAYYEDGGQNVNNLYQRLYQPSETAKYFRKIPTRNTRIKNASSDMDRVLQPFQKQFTPIGTLTFKPNPIDLFNLKIDKQEYPDDIVDTWVGFLEGDGIVREEWPFVRWMIETHIFPQMKEDYELYEAYKGVFAAPTPGVAGALGTAMDGIAEQFANHSSLINTVTVGAVPTTGDEDVAEYVESFVDGINSLYRRKIDHVFMNEDMALSFRRGMRKKYNTYYAQQSELSKVVDFPGISVVGLPSMEGVDTMWATPAWNRIRPLKKSDEARPVVASYSPRQVSIFTDWWEVLAFVDPSAVFVSDQNGGGGLPAPTNLAADNETANAMDLTWDAVSGATGYEIEYGTASDFSGATQTTATSASIALTSLTASTTYHIRVRAVGGAWATLQAATTA